MSRLEQLRERARAAGFDIRERPGRTTRHRGRPAERFGWRLVTAGGVVISSWSTLDELAELLTFIEEESNAAQLGREGRL